MLNWRRDACPNRVTFEPSPGAQMPWTIHQPIALLARAERREDAGDPPGPFRIVAWDGTDDDDHARYRTVAECDRLGDAVARIIERGSPSLQDLIDCLRDHDLEHGQLDEDDENAWDAYDTLAHDDLRARIVKHLPALEPLQGAAYLAFALDGCMGFCSTADQSPYFSEVDTAHPGWTFCVGWGAKAPYHDVALAILRRT